ncbi:hypothetical protein AB0O22_05270 [Streptomyces sp. NPDC091204]|uniref:hypothetical protein n=1 Tax=Streptomyces sp. NPDC091204 TaxID=3155299 RepID=UPI0034248CF0
MDVTGDEVQAAVALADSMTTDTLEGIRDHYRDAVEELLAAKAHGERTHGRTVGELSSPDNQRQEPEQAFGAQ